MHEDSPVTVTELAAVLEISEPDLRGCAHGPFQPDLADGAMRLRVGFGLAVLAQFAVTEALPAKLSARVAVEAASGAKIGGGHSLLIAWSGAKPAWTWFQGTATAPPLDDRERFGSPLRRAMMIVPADDMFADLAEAITTYRARQQGGGLH
jgi:hypothetical protein